MLNSVVLIGRLTREPELRYTPQGDATTSFTLAVDKQFKKGEADYINIVTWKGLAENVANYTKKGSLVAVEGRISTRNYEGKNGRVYVTEVVADNVRFLDSKRGNEPSNEPMSMEDTGIF